MMINEFLECFNNTLKQERLSKGVDSIGHFVFYQWYDKRKIGNYYEYKMRIQYVKSPEIVNSFVELSRVVQIPDNKLEKEKVIEELHKAIITSFLTKVLQPNMYESIVSDTYGVS